MALPGHGPGVDRSRHGWFMSVLSMYIDEVAKLAEKARSKGATNAPGGAREGAGELFQKFMDSVRGSDVDSKEEKKAPKVVHLLKNQPPLASKVVESIQAGAFVDFAWFPVFMDGPGDGTDWRCSLGESGEGPGGGQSGRKRHVKEVPDLSGWSTCFSLFQVAWAKEKPEMWVPLTAYREVIFKLAKRHQWGQVARYDRRFRREAAGKEDVKWDEENLSLLLDIVHATPPMDGKQGAGSSVTPARRAEQRKKNACFKFNKGEGKCVFGTHCRYAHVCSACGGEHALAQCTKHSDKS